MHGELNQSATAMAKETKEEFSGLYVPPTKCEEAEQSQTQDRSVNLFL